jgi:ribosomal protein L40E
MFCHHCGSQIADTASRCIHCGTELAPRAQAPRQAAAGLMFCRNCAAEIPREAYVCVHCGVKVAGTLDPLERAIFPEQGKSWVVTLLLALCVGPLGVHRFYTGHVVTGVLQVFTFGGLGIWWLIDVIRILVGDFKDGEGRPLVK